MEGRIWVLLTSVFSHASFFHIFLNMFVLANFGGPLERLLGPRKFLRFYLIAGILSSFVHAYVSLTLLGQPYLPALGASGAISGLVIIYCLMFPRAKILIFGLIPVNALWGAIGLVGLDLWGLLEQAAGSGLPIGYGAHLGGAFAGLIYYLISLRPQSRKPRAERYVPRSYSTY
jgi:membrane associated rhomboid family serine protease